MAVATLNLQSQVTAYEEGNGLSGEMSVGHTGSMNVAAAIRFELPEGFAEAGSVNSAVLNLHARSHASASDYRIRIGIPASTSQVLPSDLAAINGQAIGATTKTMGVGTFSPALDHPISESSYAPIAVDVALMLADAKAAGRLAGDAVVFIFRPDQYHEFSYLGIRGIGDTNPVTLVLDYGTAALTIQSAQIPASGDQLIINLSDTATVAGSGANGFAITTVVGGPVTASYVSGSGTDTLVFSLSRVINSDESLFLAYSGSAVASGSTSLAAFTDWPIAIHSTQGGTTVVPSVPLIIAGGAAEPRTAANAGRAAVPVVLAGAASEPHTSATMVGANSLIITPAAPGESQSNRICIEWLPAKAPAVRLHRSLLAIQLLLPEGMGFDSVRCENQDGSVIPSFVRAWSPDDRRLKIMVQPHHLPTAPAPIYVNLITEIE